MYGLRKISKDGKNYPNPLDNLNGRDNLKDFVWPLEVGAKFKAPEWNKHPMGGGGLLCCLNAQGGYLLRGYYWVGLEFKEKDMVLCGYDRCKIRKGKIIFISKSRKGLIKFFENNNFDSQSGYYWAKYIRKKDITLDKITDIVYANEWVKSFGDKKEMIKRFPKIKDYEKYPYC